MIKDPPPISKASVLIVDDSLPNLHLLSTMLTSNGYTVCEALDGPSALEIVSQERPDIILLDIRMPGMDGYDVCKRLKSDPLTAHIPVIFVSALDEQTDKVQGFAVGGIDYITKPFQLKEVLARVETHLTLRRLQHQLEAQNTQLQQEISDRKRAESALQKVNEELEQRVQERTAELLQVNATLSVELQERKKAQAEREQLLRQVSAQAQQVQEIMNTVPQGVLLLDHQGKIILANPIARSTLEFLANADIGDTIQSLGNRSKTELLTSPPQGLWHEIKAERRIFEAIARPLINTMPPQQWVMVIREVTQEREIQQRVQQQERLAAVGQLAAGIAHDFNNILAVIVLYTEMSQNLPDLPGKLIERMAIISQQSRRASNLIQQILDFSRRAAIERSPMNMLPFLKEQVKLLERTLPENIKVSLGYSEDDYMINADPTRMQQVIMNLAVNARDAMPEGGNFDIIISRLTSGEEIQCITCGAVFSGKWIRITFTDSGGGISEDVLPHIFEPFFTTKEPGQGTGLGLAQVYGIVKQHDGHIWTTSVGNHGSCFQIYLPALAEAPGLTSPEEADKLIQGQGQTILVVEDDDMTREAMVDGLTLLNYHVVPMANGLDALNYLEHNAGKIDLILSDVIMPELGGTELLSHIRQRQIKIPVVLMTGHPMQEELQHMRDAGLTAWILKPPTLHQVADVVSSALKAVL